MKKKSILSHIVLFAVLSIPLYFFGPNKNEELFQRIFNSVLYVVGSYVLGAICGFFLAGIIYIGGNIYIWYLGMISDKMEESIEFENNWSFEKVFDLLVRPCATVCFIVIYILSFTKIAGGVL